LQLNQTEPKQLSGTRPSMVRTLRIIPEVTCCAHTVFSCVRRVTRCDSPQARPKARRTCESSIQQRKKESTHQPTQWDADLYFPFSPYHRRTKTSMLIITSSSDVYTCLSSLRARVCWVEMHRSAICRIARSTVRSPALSVVV